MPRLQQKPLAPGSRLDRYELLWPIAEGGMASVWLARLHGKHGFEKLVAVKSILPRYANDARFVKMFLDEARIASGIEHTNVARILDLGEERQILYLAMEWVDGESLSRLQRLLAAQATALPPGVVLRVVADACAGLHAAHELKDRDGVSRAVVHRDISPQNILVSTQGVAKVIDFGVAKARDRTSDETSGSSLKGKIHYMAPEQALGPKVDRRADIWAVGAILYNFFGKRRVYEADSDLATLTLLTSGVPPANLPESVPEPIARVVMGALRYAPEDRWATADVLRRELEKAMTEAGCATSTEDVAAFLAQHVRDQTEARKATVAQALKAADERGAIAVDAPAPQAEATIATPRVQTEASPADTSSSGLGLAMIDTGQRQKTRRAGLALRAVALLAAAASLFVYVHFVRPPAAPPSSQPVAAAAPAPPPVEPISSTSPAPPPTGTPSTAASPDDGSPAPSASSAPHPAATEKRAASAPVAQPSPPHKPPPTGKRATAKASQESTDDGF